MVNASALDLFPVIGLVKKSFIRREKWSAVPLRKIVSQPVRILRTPR
jgi:hypothetical protein